MDAIKREKHAQRARRLEPGEEDRLLAYAGPHLQRLIVEMTIRAERTKTKTGRVVPISARLAAVLAMNVC